jgi:hypothetical protein
MLRLETGLLPPHHFGTATVIAEVKPIISVWCPTEFHSFARVSTVVTIETPLFKFSFLW